MDRVVVIVMLCLLSFVGGCKVATWQRDSIDLAINRAVRATGRQLAALKNAQPVGWESFLD